MNLKSCNKSYKSSIKIDWEVSSLAENRNIPKVDLEKNKRLIVLVAIQG